MYVLSYNVATNRTQTKHISDLPDKYIILINITYLDMVLRRLWRLCPDQKGVLSACEEEEEGAAPLVSSLDMALGPSE